MLKLPDDNGHTMVMVCVNQFSKTVQLTPIQKSNIYMIAYKFLSTIASWHGLPECITGDCEPQFYGYFWVELMSLLDTSLTFSMVLYPQIDKMAEVINHTIKWLLYIYM